MLARSNGHARDARVLIAAGAALLISLAGVAALIVRSQNESRQHLRANLALRATASAQLVSTYLTQQEQRQRRSGELLLAGSQPSPRRFGAVAGAFGANFAVLLDRRGLALVSAPQDPVIVGRDIGYESQAGREALEGSTTVSGVLPVPGMKGRIVGVLVPFRSARAGRRVFAAAYPVAGGELQALVDRTSTVPGHEVYLTDGAGNLIAASPRSDQGVLANANPDLSIALEHAFKGSLHEGSTARTFATAAVPGTHWRLAIDVPDAGLFASVRGLAELVPWVAFALLTLLAGVMLALLARVLGDRARLTELSSELADVARTDALTGLLNRRGLEEGLVRISGRSRRRDEPLTILMIDLDRFKEVNDQHGHEAGDLALSAFADCMREALRTEDLYGRFGGDEFLVALSDRDPGAGAAAAQRLRDTACAADLSRIGLEGGIRLSIGVASGIHKTVADLIGEADADLYRDKAGRRAAGAVQPATSTR